MVWGVLCGVQSGAKECQLMAIFGANSFSFNRPSKWDPFTKNINNNDNNNTLFTTSYKNSWTAGRLQFEIKIGKFRLWIILLEDKWMAREVTQQQTQSRSLNQGPLHRRLMSADAQRQP